MFESITFWCEFPEKTNWETINELIITPASIYVAVSSKQDFLKYKLKIKNKNITLGAWPTIPKEEGYWFSGYSEKSAIERLSNFEGIPIKIDIEPPIFEGQITIKKYLTYFFKYFTFFKAKNKEHLKQKITSLKQPIILSTFPFPDFLLKKIGVNLESSYKKNFFIYTSLLPKILQPLARLYYPILIKSKLKQNPDTMFAIGCTGPGIFGNEKYYQNTNEFKQDIEMVKRCNIKNLVIFEVASLSTKENADEWFNLINSYKK